MDECVVFGPLSAGTLERIAQRELDETCAQLREAGISLSYEPPVPGALAALAKPELGARALRRLVRTRVLEPLALLEPPGAPARWRCTAGIFVWRACGPQPGAPRPRPGPQGRRCGSAVVKSRGQKNAPAPCSAGAFWSCRRRGGRRLGR